MLDLRGRQVWARDDGTGEWYVLATIPDHLTPAEWLWLFNPGATLEGHLWEADL